MRLRHMILAIASSSIFISCELNEEQLYGTYVSNNSENNIDSLFLYENSTYRHSIYLKDETTMILNHQGKWVYESGYLDLDNFYNNDNRKFRKDVDYKFEENYILTSTPVRSSFGKIKIDINADLAREYIKVTSESDNP